MTAVGASSKSFKPVGQKGWVGHWLQARLDPDMLKVAVAVIFVLIGLFMLWTLIL